MTLTIPRQGNAMVMTSKLVSLINTNQTKRLPVEILRRVFKQSVAPVTIVKTSMERHKSAGLINMISVRVILYLGECRTSNATYTDTSVLENVLSPTQWETLARVSLPTRRQYCLL